MEPDFYYPLNLQPFTEPVVTVSDIPCGLTRQLKTFILIQATISTLVEIYMGWRIRKLTSSNLLFGLIAFLAFSSLGNLSANSLTLNILRTSHYSQTVGGVSSTILVSLMPEYSQFINFQGAILTWLISSATADIVIAVSLVVYLVSNTLSLHFLRS